MTNTWRDVVATALVAVVVVFYVGYLAFGSMPLVEDVRGMAAVGLICGFASRRIGGREAFEHEKAAMAGALASMALGIAALATESGAVLALFILSIVGLWFAALYVRTGGFRTGHLHPSH